MFFSDGRIKTPTDGLQAAHERAKIACKLAAKRGKTSADSGGRDRETGAQRARKIMGDEQVQCHKTTRAKS